MNLRAKYKSTRHPLDSLFLSPNVKSIFNKFIRKGKKAFAYKHVLKGLIKMRYSVRKPPIQFIFANLVHELLVSVNIFTKYDMKKKGKKKSGTDIPVPFKRLRGFAHPAKIIFAGVSDRSEALLSEKIGREMCAVTVNRKESRIIVQQGKYIRRSYDARINEDKRFY